MDAGRKKKEPLKRFIVLNEDNDHFFKFPPEYMDVEHLEQYIDMLAEGGKVTHINFCPCGGRASFDSKTWEPIWRGLEETPPEKTWFLYRRWAENAKALHDKGIDPYAVWIRRCRERGISPWLAPRLNDVHDAAASLTHFYRSTSFWRNRRDLRLYPDYDKTSWYHHQFNYAHPEVRDDAFAMLAELFERYDFDGLSICGNAWFPKETARESVPILNDYMRKIRRLADEWQKKRGHRIELSAQISGSPEDCRNHGFDVATLAREGVFACVICDTHNCNADIPVDAWRRELGEGGARLIAGAHERHLAADGLKRYDCTAEMYRGWADAVTAKGADGYHFWNLQYAPEAQFAVAHYGLDPNDTRQLPRTYVCKAKGGLPLKLDAERRLTAQVGSLTNGVPSVLLGFRAAPPRALKVSVNGRQSIWESDTHVLRGVFAENDRDNEHQAAFNLQARRVFFPRGTVKTGTNEILIAPKNAEELVFAELHLDP